MHQGHPRSDPPPLHAVVLLALAAGVTAALWAAAAPPATWTVAPGAVGQP